MTKCATTYRKIRLHFLRQVLLNPADPGLGSRVGRPQHPSSSDLRRPLRSTEPFAWRIGHRLGRLDPPRQLTHGPELATCQRDISDDQGSAPLSPDSISHPRRPARRLSAQDLRDAHHAFSLRPSYLHRVLAAKRLLYQPALARVGRGNASPELRIQQVQPEQVPVVMKASPTGVALYEKSGFRRLRREEFGAFFDTEGDEYWRMVWEPEGGGGEERRMGRVRGDD